LNSHDSPLGQISCRVLQLPGSRQSKRQVPDAQMPPLRTH
jgi:hypothetical protein